MKRLHERERKLRLTDEADDLLLALAAMRDVPPAVLGRELLMRELRRAAHQVGAVLPVNNEVGRAA